MNENLRKSDMDAVNDFFGKPAETPSVNPLDKQIEEVNAQIAAASMTPASIYLKNLSEVNVTKEKAATIIDTVCVQLRPYEESVEIFKNVRATFRTRQIASTREFNKIVENMRPTRDATLMDELRIHALSTSLVKYGEKTFDPSKDRATSVAWLSEIPEVIFDLLYQKLYEFDRRVSAVFAPGYLENF